MPKKSPIESPASYATSVAIGFADQAGDLVLVTADTPLPVSAKPDIAPLPLSGTTSQTGLAGPYSAQTGTAIHLQLSGDWAGRVSLVRSVDGGATRQGLTAGGMRWASFTANVNEAVWQESEKSARFYLDIELASGTLNYRVSQ